MRDIKFRAWDKVSKKMLMIGLVDLDDMTVYSAKSGDFRCSYQRKTKCSKNENFEDVKRLVFMQYTGIKDKNGKEIYEGDIFATDNNHNFTVIYEDTRFIGVDGDRSGNGYVCCVDSCYKNGSSSIEVIGNIYENPELLKEGNK
jgi:hypothetical protein